VRFLSTPSLIFDEYFSDSECFQSIEFFEHILKFSLFEAERRIKEELAGVRTTEIGQNYCIGFFDADPFGGFPGRSFFNDSVEQTELVKFAQNPCQNEKIDGMFYVIDFCDFRTKIVTCVKEFAGKI